jgi:hypothetical protein
MGTGEGGIHELAGVRMARMDGHTGHVLVGVNYRREVREIEPGIHPLAIHVQRHGDDIQVARPLSVAEQRPLDPLGTGQEAELGRGDAGPPIVVGVQADDRTVSPAQPVGEPLDLVGVDVRRGAFHRGGKVQNDGPFGSRPPFVHDRLADFQSVVRFGLGEVSGEYSRVISVPESIERRSLTMRTPLIATSLICSRVMPKVYFRWEGEVEL